MSNPFAIQFSPRESAASDALDRVTEADIGIVVGAACLTELEDRVAKTVRSTFRASAYRLAHWLAENWWRLRWEPESNHLDWQMSHNLAAIGAGYLWPALTFSSDGEYVTLRMRSSTVVPTEDIRYLAQQDLRISSQTFVTGIDHFIGAVIERMRATDHTGTSLEQLWNDIQEERREAETAHWRKLEALAGLDPDAEAGAFLSALLPQQSAIGPSGLEELVAACREATQSTLNTLADIAGIILKTRHTGPRAVAQAGTGNAQKNRGSTTLSEQNNAPWQRAYQARPSAPRLGPRPWRDQQCAAHRGLRRRGTTAPHPKHINAMSDLRWFSRRHSGTFSSRWPRVHQQAGALRR